MSDVLAFKSADGIWLAKNSSREPDEPQRVEFHPAGEYPPDIQTTYLRVKPLTPLRQAIIIGRPDWMWGAEMGVNAAGVAIGNVAVLTRVQDRFGMALPGADLLRLALEQGSTAQRAAKVIIHYLEEAGQGGPSSRHHSRTRHDSSFLLADQQTLLKLETAGRFWALQTVGVADAISNALTIQGEADCQSFPDQLSQYGEIGFADTFNRWWRPRIARARQRRQQSLEFMRNLLLQDDPGVRQAIQQHLASHADGSGNPSGNADMCLHAKGWCRTLATVNTLLVRLPTAGSPQVWMTGASHPCRQLFHEVKWGRDHFFADKPGYWEAQRSQVP